MTTSVVHTNSRALRGAVTYSIITPDPASAGPGPYHVLLQLHGRFDDNFAWVEKSRLAMYVERIPLIVVMPAGGNFWWSNFRIQQAPGASTDEFSLDYEDYLIQDLRAHVESTYNTRTGEPWAIGGLSMGGFGALRLGLKHNELFSSVFAHSSVIPNAEELDQWLPSLTTEARADMDVYRHAAARTPADMPRLGFDCGVDDWLINHNRRLHDHLDRLSLPHTYAEHPGEHTWDYWDLHVRTALMQHCAVLGIAPLPVPAPSESED